MENSHMIDKIAEVVVAGRGNDWSFMVNESSNDRIFHWWSSCPPIVLDKWLTFGLNCLGMLPL